MQLLTDSFFTTGEPIRPIDPAAWVSHTAAMTGTYPAYGMSPSMSTITSTSSSITSSIPETERKSLSLRAPPAARLPRLHCAVKGAIHLRGDSWGGQALPCMGTKWEAALTRQVLRSVGVLAG